MPKNFYKLAAAWWVSLAASRGAYVPADLQQWAWDEVKKDLGGTNFSFAAKRLREAISTELNNGGDEPHEWTEILRADAVNS